MTINSRETPNSLKKGDHPMLEIGRRAENMRTVAKVIAVGLGVAALSFLLFHMGPGQISPLEYAPGGTPNPSLILPTP